MQVRRRIAHTAQSASVHLQCFFWFAGPPFPLSPLATYTVIGAVISGGSFYRNPLTLDDQ
jgi:hypothetical protein